ncbi:unnamed protein product, partial [Ectocarpus fasciculatus]
GRRPDRKGRGGGERVRWRARAGSRKRLRVGDPGSRKRLRVGDPEKPAVSGQEFQPPSVLCVFVGVTEYVVARKSSGGAGLKPVFLSVRWSWRFMRGDAANHNGWKEAIFDGEPFSSITQQSFEVIYLQRPCLPRVGAEDVGFPLAWPQC